MGGGEEEGDGKGSRDGISEGQGKGDREGTERVRRLTQYKSNRSTKGNKGGKDGVKKAEWKREEEKRRKEQISGCLFVQESLGVTLYVSRMQSV